MASIGTQIVVALGIFLLVILVISLGGYTIASIVVGAVVLVLLFLAYYYYNRWKSASPASGRSADRSF